MTKGALVAKHEYLEIVRTKAFWLGLLAFPIIITLAILVPILMERTREARTFAVVDHSGYLAAAVDERIYAEDLRTILRETHGRRREGGRDFERLPPVLRELTHAWLELDEEDRDAFVELLVREETPSPAGLTGRAAELATPTGRERLRRWWEEVGDAELDDLEIELSRHSFVRVEGVSSALAEGALEELNGQIDGGGLFAYIVIGPDPVSSSSGCKYVSNNLTDRDLVRWYRRLASDVVRTQRIVREGLDPEVAQWLREPLSFQDHKIGEAGEEKEVATRDKARQWAPVGFTYLLWIAIFTSAQMLLTSTIEEKTARVIEVLLSSVSPFELMAGKIAGVAAAGLTVVASWAGFILLAVGVVPIALGAPKAVEVLRQVVADPLLLLGFVLYFLLGYLFYAAVLVGLGSVCNSLKDAQNLMLPVMIPMMAAIFALVPISRDPNGTFARVMSFIPPFTPFVMMNRAAGPPAAWEYVATTVLLLAAIYVAVWSAAKIFRIGILMTGKPPRIREMARWLTIGGGVTPPTDTET